MFVYDCELWSDSKAALHLQHESFTCRRVRRSNSGCSGPHASTQPSTCKKISWQPASVRLQEDQKAPAIQSESNKIPDKSPWRGFKDEPSEQQAECMYACLGANIFFIHSKTGLISPQTPRHKLNPPANHSTSRRREGRSGGSRGKMERKSKESKEKKHKIKRSKGNAGTKTCVS